MSISRKPIFPGSLPERLVVSLPQSEVQELIRLAELAGTTFSRELVRVLEFFLETEGGLPSLDGPLMREALETVEGLAEPWEPVQVSLPGWALSIVRDVAEAYGISEDHALAVLTRRTVRGLLRLEQRALERHQGLTDALRGWILEDAA